MPQVKVAGTTFEYPSQYENIKPIGLGAFGLVCSVIDTKTNEQRAIKKIGQPFKNNILAKRAFRELMLLHHLHHENVISLRDVYMASDPVDLYFVTDLLGADLYRLLAMKPLEPQYIKFFTFQILHGLRYVHQAGVIHRDLKPANILVNENCDLKICDFGLARVSEAVMTGYVATRYYRAPEIMLSWQKYDNEIDLWSVGCILAEMVEGKKVPVFPGKDHQYTYIAELLGSPPADLIDSISSENTLRFVHSLGKYEHSLFEERFKHYETDVVDLIRKLLVWDPKKRLSARVALKHAYFDEYRESDYDEDEISPFDWSFTEQDISSEEWQARVVLVMNQIKERNSS